MCIRDSYDVFGKVYQQQGAQPGADAGFNAGSANGSTNTGNDGAVDADYEVVDDNN